MSILIIGPCPGITHKFEASIDPFSVTTTIGATDLFAPKTANPSLSAKLTTYATGLLELFIIVSADLVTASREKYELTDNILRFSPDFVGTKSLSVSLRNSFNVLIASSFVIKGVLFLSSSYMLISPFDTHDIDKNIVIIVNDRFIILLN